MNYQEVAGSPNLFDESMFSHFAQYVVKPLGIQLPSVAPTNVANVNCAPKKAELNAVINNTNVQSGAPTYQWWDQAYGGPCYFGKTNFGTVTHTFVLTARAIKFYGEKVNTQGKIVLYNYWMPISKVEARIKYIIPNLNASSCILLITVGTYNCWSDANRTDSYYAPHNPVLYGNYWVDAGNAYSVKESDGKIFTKLKEFSYMPEQVCPNLGCNQTESKKATILGKLGYPIGSKTTAATSSFGTNGYYQKFIGGTVFVETEYRDEAYYVPGFINEYYYDNGSTSGELGFPVSDPQYNVAEVKLFQDFENGTRVYDQTNKVVTERISTGHYNYESPIARNMLDERYRDDFFEGIQDSFAEMGLLQVALDVTSGVITEELIERLIVKGRATLIEKFGQKIVLSTGIKFAPAVGWLYAGASAAQFAIINAPLLEACNTDPDLVDSNVGYKAKGKMPAYYCGKLAFNGTFALLGVVGNGVVNRFGVKTKLARLGKAKLFSNIDSKTDVRDIVDAITFYDPKIQQKRTTFMENIASDFTDISYQNIVKDGKLMKLLVKDVDIFDTFKWNKVYKGPEANSLFPVSMHPFLSPVKEVQLS